MRYASKFFRDQIAWEGREYRLEVLHTEAATKNLDFGGLQRLIRNCFIACSGQFRNLISSNKSFYNNKVRKKFHSNNKLKRLVCYEIGTSSIMFTNKFYNNNARK